MTDWLNKAKKELGIKAAFSTRVALGIFSLFSVVSLNVIGYVSKLPSSMQLHLDTSFMFSHILIISIYLAAALFLGKIIVVFVVIALSAHMKSFRRGRVSRCFRLIGVKIRKSKNINNLASPIINAYVALTIFSFMYLGILWGIYTIFWFLLFFFFAGLVGGTSVYFDLYISKSKGGFPSRESFLQIILTASVVAVLGLSFVVGTHRFQKVATEDPVVMQVAGQSINANVVAATANGVIAIYATDGLKRNLNAFYAPYESIEMIRDHEAISLIGTHQRR